MSASVDLPLDAVSCHLALVSPCLAIVIAIFLVVSAESINAQRMELNNRISVGRLDIHVPSSGDGAWARIFFILDFG